MFFIAMGKRPGVCPSVSSPEQDESQSKRIRPNGILRPGIVSSGLSACWTMEDAEESAKNGM